VSFTVDEAFAAFGVLGAVVCGFEAVDDAVCAATVAPPARHAERTIAIPKCEYFMMIHSS
jgi:hypothetical protein